MKSISMDATARISNALVEIERERNATILYACESGSRAWGFPSQDSDYDVRFIYVRPLDSYLSIHEWRDVIEEERDDDLDINGWDIKKALKLFQRCNPPLIEWLRSPIVYTQKNSFVESLRGLIDDFFSPKACMHHYFHMAEGNYKEYLQGEIVWVKKYLYVLRPLLACDWILKYSSMPPTEFSVLVNCCVESNEVKGEIVALVKEKQKGEELRHGKQNKCIDSFIQQKRGFFNNQLRKIRKHEKPPDDSLNSICQDTIKTCDMGEE